MSRPRSGSASDDIAFRDATRTLKLEALHRTLGEKIAAIRDGQDWRDWLNVASRFHTYSFNNQILIAAQRPDATAVAGFAAWKALGRQVNKGERGIQILAPVLLRAAPPGADPAPPVHAGSSEQRPSEPNPAAALAVDSSGHGRIAAFRVVHVFDLAQTSGDPLPEQPLPKLLSGQAPYGLWDTLATQVASHGFALERGECGEANGATNFVLRAVRIRADVDDAQAVKTLCHELAHVLLHDPNGGPTAAADPAASSTDAHPMGYCRGRFEVEAESVAYLIAAIHGLDTSAYTFPYVAGWAGSVDAVEPDRVVQATAQRVLGAARQILTATEHLGTSNQASSDLPEVKLIADVAACSEQARQRTSHLATAIGQTNDALQQQLESPAVAAAPPKARGLSSVTDSKGRKPSDARLVHAHDVAVEFYQGRLQAGDTASLQAAELLHVRGVRPEAILEAGIGYAPADWTQLVDHLRRHGIGDDELVASGLVLRSSRDTLVDRFRDRLIFPVTDTNGHTVALLGRSVTRSSVDRNGNPIPKYLNSPETQLYRKGEVLYGLHGASAALAAGAIPVLVEGPMDALAINCAGTTGTLPTSLETQAYVGVAPCGTGLTARQVELLEQSTKDFREQGVVVAFDGDTAGRAAAVRAFGMLRPTGVWPRALILTDGVDPALLLQRHGPDALYAALDASSASPLADLVVDARIDRYGEQLRWAEGQVAACRAAASLIASLPPEHVAHQVGRLVSRLELPHQAVNDIVIEAVCNPGRQGRQADLPATSERVRLVNPPPIGVGQTAPQRAQAGFPVPLTQALRTAMPVSSPVPPEVPRGPLGQASLARRQA
jgi:DNA primase